ncbi:MAG TPA: glycosyltransferase, partial [Gemmataceae bacterium]|nr:glycosyltransferase [Gemmataceae bacterium]
MAETFLRRWFGKKPSAPAADEARAEIDRLLSERPATRGPLLWLRAILDDLVPDTWYRVNWLTADVVREECQAGRPLLYLSPLTVDADFLVRWQHICAALAQHQPGAVPAGLADVVRQEWFDANALAKGLVNSGPEAVRRAAERGRKHGCVLAYSVGNEIPPNIVRWSGARRIERFLAELADVARQADPAGLVTYASYPPTEYLDLSALDFATFNVYLHDRETFRRYLLRLQNLVGDRPLLLGELGMDTLRHGEQAQAEFLAGHLVEARLLGLAGAFVFSWTDDWFTGGYQVEDWAFGITHADRFPKASCHALRELFQHSPAGLLPETPRVSVVVCTYNGGKTLAQCLGSLLVLDYPDYEVIVVDDGSTDDTREILSRFPTVGAASR